MPKKETKEKIKIYKNGKLLKRGKDFDLLNGSIYFTSIPQKRRIIKLEYYRTPKELKNK